MPRDGRDGGRGAGGSPGGGGSGRGPSGGGGHPGGPGPSAATGSGSRGSFSRDPNPNNNRGIEQGRAVQGSLGGVRDRNAGIERGRTVQGNIAKTPGFFDRSMNAVGDFFDGITIGDVVGGLVGLGLTGATGGIAGLVGTGMLSHAVGAMVDSAANGEAGVPGVDNGPDHSGTNDPAIDRHASRTAAYRSSPATYGVTRGLIGKNNGGLRPQAVGGATAMSPAERFAQTGVSPGTGAIRRGLMAA